MEVLWLAVEKSVESRKNKFSPPEHLEKKLKIEKLTPVSAEILKKLVTGLLLSKLTLASAQHALINPFFFPYVSNLKFKVILSIIFNLFEALLIDFI